MFEAGSLIFRIQTVGAGLFKSELQQADEAAKKAGRSVSESAKSTSELGKQADYTRPKLRQVTGEIRNMSAEAQGASREVGGAMMLIGAAIIAAVGLTVKAATEWESAWAGVRKTLDGTDEEMADVEAGLRAMSKELPASHREIAAVAEAAGQLGVSAENVTAFTRTMIDLGETTNLTSEEAATSLAQLMNVMRTSPEDVGRLGSAVVALGNNGASTERDIVQMAQRIAGAAQIIGLTEGEALGLANALASVGIEAEAGGSSISTIMIDISRAVSENGDDLREWAKLTGLSADEFGKKWKAEPAEALALVVEGMGRLNASGGDVFGTLSKLGQSDVRVTRSLLSLAGAGDMLRESLALGNQAYEDNNALQEEAQKRYDTTAAKLAVTRNAINDAAIELGQHLLPLVVDGAEAVTGFASALSGAEGPLLGAAALTGVLAGAIALSAGAAMVAVPRYVAFQTAVATLAATMPNATIAAKGFASFVGGPWGVLIAAGAVGLSILNDYLKSLQASSEEVTNSLTTASDSAEVFATLTQGKEGTYGFFRDVIGDLENMSAMLDKVKNENDNLFARFTTETHGFRDALRSADASMAELASGSLPKAQEAFRLLTDGQDLSTEQLWTLIDSMPAYRDALIEQATAQGINVSTGDEMLIRQALVNEALGTASDRAAAARDEYMSAAKATEQFDRDLNALLATLDEANGQNQDAITSNIDYQRTLREAEEQIALARQGVEGYGLGLDQATEAGARNVETLLEIAQASREAADGQYTLDGNTDAYLQRLQDGRQQIIDTAIAFGATADEAQKLADKIYAMPDEKQIEVLASTSAAARMLDTFIATYNNRRITMSMFLEATGNNRGAAADAARLTGQALNYINQADGGNVKFFGSGGEHHVAQFARAGDMRVWAEPETGGEWYIPDGAAKRPRSMMLAEQMLNGWGYTMAPVADRAPAGAAEPLAINVIVQSRGGIDLTEFVEVTVEQSVESAKESLNRGVRR